MISIVVKLVTKAKKIGHCVSKPFRRVPPTLVGSLRPRTSSVMAKAKTPSLKASRRAVSFASNLAILIGA